jgi:hypothetical protein
VLERLTFLTVTLGLLAAPAQGRALSPDEQAFLREHLSEVVKVEPDRLADDAVVRVFATPIYRITVVVKEGDGATSTSSAIAARRGNELVAVSRPSTDGDYPEIQRMFRRDFKLTSEAAAETLQKALDVVYPILGGSDKAARGFRRDGKQQWTFVRGEFFDKQMGFVLTTDGSGSITAVRYVLKLP